MKAFECQAQTEIFRTYLCSAKSQWMLAVQYAHDYVCLPNFQLLLVTMQRSTRAYDPPMVDPSKT